MERIPILKMGDYLLVTIQVDMHDRLALTLQDDLTQRIVADHSRGVLIDISSLEVVDSFIGRTIGNIAAMSRYPFDIASRSPSRQLRNWKRRCKTGVCPCSWSKTQKRNCSFTSTSSGILRFA